MSYVLSGMDRRKFLQWVGSGAIGAGGVVTAQNGGDVEKTIGDVSEAMNGVLGGILPQSKNGGRTQSFGLLSPSFEKIEFQRVIASNFNGWIAIVTFGSHDMDGFGVRHTSLDSIEDDIYVCQAPKSTGTQRFPIARLLRRQDPVYPNRQFDLIAYEGEFSDCGSRFQFNVSLETKGSAGFTVPKEVAPASAFRDLPEESTEE